jgi:hypothetical protein|tara:strand:- start:89 stop:481 length:393 start_codon:yes stop_codon:yes gene_type:complete
MIYAPLELKQRAFDLYANGHRCSEIASILTKEHEQLTGRPLTRNSIIGWRDRSPRNKLEEALRLEKKVVIKVDFDVYMKELHNYKCRLEETTKKKYRIRKCLRCQKESVLPKNIFLCGACKNHEVFSYST